MQSLFEDTTLKSMFDGLSKQEQDKYRADGEQMYSLDYEKRGTSEDDTFINAAAYIGEALKSGLRPSQLDVNEIEVMRSVFGKTWYENYGYTAESD